MKAKVARPIQQPTEEENTLCSHPEKGYFWKGIPCCDACYLHQLRKEYYPTKLEEDLMKAKTTVSKSKLKEEPVKEKTPKIAGKTLGLNVRKTWCHIFQENEKLRSQKKSPKTDAQITEFMMAEFPERKSKTFNAVAHWRTMYNKGLLGMTPSTPSTAYEPKK